MWSLTVNKLYPQVVIIGRYHINSDMLSACARCASSGGKLWCWPTKCTQWPNLYCVSAPLCCITTCILSFWRSRVYQQESVLN